MRKSILAKSLSAVVILSMVLCYVTVPVITNAALGANVFPAGDFEADTLIPYVQHSATAELTTAQHQGISGTKSMKVVMGGGYSGVSIPVNLSPGKTYSYSFWIKFESGIGQRININYRKNPGTPNQSDGDAYTEYRWGNTDWKQMNGIFTYNGSASDQASLLVYCNDQNTFYLDNIEFREFTPYGLLENQVENGDFETTSSLAFGSGAAKLSYETSDVFSGSSAMKVEQTGGYGNIQAAVYPKAGSTYFASVRAKLLGTDISTPLQLNLMYFDSEESMDNHTFGTPVTLNSNNGYTLATGIVKIPSGINVRNAKISMFAYPVNDSGVTFLIDELKFYEIPGFSLLSSTPANNAVTTIDTSVTLNFSNDLDAATATNINNYALNGSNSFINSVTMPNSKSLLVTFKGLLAELQSYNFTATGIKDAYGQSYSGTINFETKQQGKPAIIASTPANKAYNIPIDNVEMTVEFDSNMNASTVAAGNITVNGATALVKSVTKITEKQYKIALNKLANSTLYNVKFSNIAGADGGIMDDKVISFFTTGDIVVMDNDMEGPDDLFTGRSPDQYIDPTTGISTDYANSGNSSLKVVVLGKYGNIAYQPTVEPGATYEMTYYAKSTNNITKILPGCIYVDGFDTYLPELILGGLTPSTSSEFTKKTSAIKFTNSVWKFYFQFEEPTGVVYIDDLKLSKIGATTLVPFSSPANNAVDVPTNTKITLVFNHAMDKASLSGNVKINGATDLVGNIAINSEDPNKVEITLKSDLQSSKAYTVTVDNAKDVYGQTVSGVSTTFTTKSKYDIQGFKLYKNYSTTPVELTGASLAQGTVSAVIQSATNNSGTDGGIALIVGLYKGTQLVKAQVVRTDLTAHGALAQPLVLNFDVPELSNGDYYLKSYVWEDMVNSEPIYQSLKITE